MKVTVAQLGAVRLRLEDQENLATLGARSGDWSGQSDREVEVFTEGSPGSVRERR